ncbi:MAG: TldD/PmbA family protein [Streptosporangiales bacterium]|nr:TldD/PmbA family protein [Streptosporangiales bacterium]
MSKLTAQQAVEHALRLSRADGCIVIVDVHSHVDLRWAVNSLTSNGRSTSWELTVIATVDGATGTSVGTVSRSGVAPDQIESVVRAAERAAQDSTAAEDAQPLAEPGLLAADDGWDEPPAETSAAVFGALAPALGEAFKHATADDRSLFGFAEHDTTTTYLGTSSGLRLRHAQPSGRLELNGKSADFSRSAWMGSYTRDFTDVDIAALDASLTTRLGWAERRVDLPAGRYETLLPPSAVADLMIPFYWSASARDAHEGRTVFGKGAGETRVGERLTDQPLTVRSDPGAAGLECCPFVVAHASTAEQSIFDNGLPGPAVRWVDDGVLAALLQTRHSAELTGLPATFGVDNLIVEGPADAPDLDTMIANTSRGLLLTCLWYVRTVDPATLLLTGLTRDGVYLVENGEVTAAVNNFRFNESPVGMLGRVTEIGRSEHTLARELSDYFTRTSMSPLRVAEFNMSTVSDAS